MKDAEANAEEDKKFEGLVQAKNNADMLVHATRKTVDESGDKLSDDEKESIEKAVTDLENAIKEENIDSIEASTKSLNDVLTPLSEKLYQAGEDQGVSEEPNNSDDENTVEAEFEEVKEEDSK